MQKYNNRRLVILAVKANIIGSLEAADIKVFIEFAEHQEV